MAELVHTEDEYGALYREAGRCIDAATANNSEWLPWLRVHDTQRWARLEELMQLVAAAREERVPIEQFGTLLAIFTQEHLRAFTVWLQRDPTAPPPAVN